MMILGDNGSMFTAWGIGCELGSHPMIIYLATSKMAYLIWDNGFLF